MLDSKTKLTSLSKDRICLAGGKLLGPAVELLIVAVELSAVAAVLGSAVEQLLGESG